MKSTRPLLKKKMPKAQGLLKIYPSAGIIRIRFSGYDLSRTRNILGSTPWGKGSALRVKS